MSRVLRFARSDEENEFVLLHVVKLGPAALDLSLTATEGESPYTARVQESHLKELCAKSYQGPDEEWTQIIAYVLGQADPTQKLPAWSGVAASIHITGSTEENKEMVITVRKRVQSITQRLGAIILKQNDQQAIELFDWSGLAAARAGELESQVIDLTDRVHAAEDTVQKLNEQLEELMRAKTQHEVQLVANFVQLLNEKKLKIRTQQRLLASATMDPTKAAEIQAATAKVHATRGEPQSTKRNAHDMGDKNGDIEEDFEKMDVDQEKNDDQDTDAGGQYTPQQLEEGNTTTDDEFWGLETAQASVKSDRTRVEGSSSKAAAPPPRRELPFTRRGPSAKAEVAPAPSEVAEETAGETDDDEL
ncbi:uncharacterized protein N7484_008754 [Penicillium longicatenatum]|uniref:uncharacterized protein n=1 Tax=Penicillium longicatenatum TaxID=1561947 RepID=UPI002546AE94|nr:uncharacterized protein N7484_008754 [Penicillium longicatenatum]KAJ5635441.1 hypothetical protein N7484_008754 [Penicillium longicatenatum]